MAPPTNNKRKRAIEKPVGGKRWKPQSGTGATEDGEPVQDPVQQEASLKAYMFHANKLLHKACKTSKNLEVQKLTRKIKTTREPKDGKEFDQTVLNDLEAQLAALKAISIDSIPPHMLSSRIPKLPTLRNVDFVPALVATIPKSEWIEYAGQSTEGKARNRVLASKQLVEAWEEVVRAIKKRMGEEVEPAAKKDKDKGKAKQVETLPSPALTGQDAVPPTEKRLSKRAERAKRAEETKKNLPKRSMEMSAERRAALEALGAEADSEEVEDESEDEGPIAGSEDEELDDDEIERELALLNGDVGSEGEWSGSEDEEDDGFASDTSLPPAAERPTKRSKVSASPPPTAKKAKTAREAPKPVTSSAFLPSLAAGYVSYSNSDGEDAKWVKAAERENKKGERKNRRGQRARQAIWEKKYGQAAAHVVKATGGKPLPIDKLKANKKAIRSGESAPKSRREAQKKAKDEPAAEEKPFDPLHARGGSTNPNAQPVAPRKIGYGAPAPAVTEKVHPSWEAKRKAAEALKTTQPQGKKITFD
ncbi:BUD22 family protein [Sporobolomyces koalae]|uniref:BUD22 family protein n=1 Tax=Sporobolomyces koalae TaxID=500713 RepID=UPI003175A1E7